MGYNARSENALTVLGALERVLTSQGHRVAPGVGVEAARAFAVAPAVPAAYARLPPDHPSNPISTSARRLRQPRPMTLCQGRRTVIGGPDSAGSVT